MLISSYLQIRTESCINELYCCLAVLSGTTLRDYRLQTAQICPSKPSIPSSADGAATVRGLTRLIKQVLRVNPLEQLREEEPLAT